MKKTNLTSSTLSPPPGSGGVTNDIRGIKPPVDIPGSLWPWILALVLLTALAMLWYQWRKRRNAARLEPPAPPVPPHIRAKQRLEQSLSLISDPKLFCISVSDATRSYLEERFALHAPERTTEEFLYELQHTAHLLSDQKITLGQFLERCDLVKFARLEPTEAELRSLHDIALRLVDETAPMETPATATPPPLPTPAS